MPPHNHNRIIKTILHRLPDVQAVYRFGSWETQYERSDSDIDLAILPIAPRSSMERWELAQELASALNRDVDLVDLLQASTVMRAQVIAHGDRLYCCDETVCATFEVYVFSAYARLNEERSAILDRIHHRGRVYGG